MSGKSNVVYKVQFSNKTLKNIKMSTKFNDLNRIWGSKY